MPDFLAHVRRHLPPFGVSGAQEAEVVEELAAELQERYEKMIRSGAEPDDAWRRLNQEIDWPKLAADFRATFAADHPPEPDRARKPEFLSNLRSDVRFGLRLLARSPGFAATAILTIALGIGPNTAIFSLLYAVFWAPDSPNVVRQTVVWSRHDTAPSYGVRGGIHVSTRDYLEWKRENTSFERLDAIFQRNVNLNDDADYPERIQIQSYTPGAVTGYYGKKMVLGRDIAQEEGQPGKNNVVVISHRFWQQRYKGDPDVLGKQIRLDGVPHSIVGVVEPGPWDRRREPMWGSLAVSPEQPNQQEHMLTVLGLRKPGVTNQQAEAELNSIAARLAQKYPGTNAGWTVRVDQAKNQWLNQRTNSNLGMLMAAVSLILLIACLNVANLLLARGGARLKEVAVRISMGATKRQIFAQLTTESILLSLMGGLVGVALSWVLLKIFLGLLPPFAFPPVVDIRLSREVLLFSLTTSVLAGFLFGCAPALQVARLGIAESLRGGGGRSGVGLGRHHLGRILVVAEFAVALTLLAAAGVVIENYWKRMHADFGVRTANVLTFELPPRAGRFKGLEEIFDYNRILKEKLEAIPGVLQMTAAAGLPLAETGSARFAVARKAPLDAAQFPQVRFRMAGPGFFETFGAEVRKGRPFDNRDHHRSMPVVMVNEAFARKHLDGLDPLAEELLLQPRPGQPPFKLRIVGVYKDIQNGEQFGSEIRPEVIAPLTQFVNAFTTIAVRTSGDPSHLVKPIAAAIHELDREMPMAKIRTMEQVVADATAFDRFEAALYGGFGILALLLSVVGIYGLLAYVVSQRTAELGMRMALGADTAAIFRLVIRDGLKLATAGLALGLAGANYGTRILQSSLYGAKAVNPAALGVVAALLLAAALSACVIPAWRAAAVDPLRTLREP